MGQRVILLENSSQTESILIRSSCLPIPKRINRILRIPFDKNPHEKCITLRNPMKSQHHDNIFPKNNLIATS